MTDVALAHQAAMALVDDAYAARARGEMEAYVKLTREAFELERSAALATVAALEPTRSVLLRSAASLALEISEFREAERLISIGLSGEPPAPIADELRDLLEQVHFERHLNVRGLMLGPNDFRLSIWGNAVGYGMADSDEFVGRVSTTEKLLFRTAERRKGRPYREKGLPERGIRNDFKLYMAAPGGGSFSVVFKLGIPTTQQDMWKPSETTAIISDFLDCLSDFNTGRLDSLEKYIGNEAYFTNFVGLAKELAPDGEAVKGVDLTARTVNADRHVTLDQPRRRRRATGATHGPRDAATSKQVEISGFLRFADELTQKNHIKIETKDSKIFDIAVPVGMMADIVKPRWGEFVTAVCKRRPRDALELIEVIEAEEDEE